ncbi:hypothetical protein [Brevibacillus sp. SAFN-007a]|uniref:hypothetical protein n=1 Tax=Brevibacillus sp. SAFN-007a TaxID=3436862 RepID=UPI003F80C2A3
MRIEVYKLAVATACMSTSLLPLRSGKKASACPQHICGAQIFQAWYIGKHTCTKMDEKRGWKR